MLELKDICKTFNPNTINAKVALNHLNLTLNDGDFVTVIGGNGAGKSTMLNAIAGVFQVDSGTITIDGQDVTKLPEHKRAAFLGRVFQDPMMGTAPTMQIEENLALAARRGQPRGLKWGITALERADYRELLKTLDLGLEDRLTAKVGLLSGGQRQVQMVQRHLGIDGIGIERLVDILQLKHGRNLPSWCGCGPSSRGSPGTRPRSGRTPASDRWCSDPTAKRFAERCSR